MDYASLPAQDAIAVPVKGHPLSEKGKLPKLRMGDKFMRWFSGLSARVDSVPQRLGKETLTGQHASIGTTPLDIDTVTQGIWRISVTVRVTTPGSVAPCTIQVSILWTERAVVQIESGAVLAGNLTTTREGKTFIIRTDGASPISYSTTYADGGGATPMAYSLDIVAEELSADPT